MGRGRTDANEAVTPTFFWRKNPYVKAIQDKEEEVIIIYKNFSFLDKDEYGIPSQFPVQEDTQFLQLLRESLDFFGIDEKQHRNHFLIDYKTRKIKF